MEKTAQIFQPNIWRRRSLSADWLKSDILSLYFVRPLCRGEATRASLLCRVLSMGSNQYPSLRALSQREDELYGAILSFDWECYADYLVLDFKLIYPRYLQLDHPELTSQARDFLTSVVFDPLRSTEGFDQDIFRTEKAKLESELAAIQQDPVSYATLRCAQLHFRARGPQRYQFADLDELEGIQNTDLWAYYLQLLNGPAYYYRQGDFSEEMYAAIEPIQLHQAFPEKPDYLECSEGLDFQQSILVQAYHCDITWDEPAAEAAQVFHQILGGEQDSLLYRDLRDKHGLCYFVYSEYDKYAQVLYITVGYDPADQARVKQQIAQCIERVRQGQVSPREIDRAKSTHARELMLLSDDPITYIDYLFLQDLIGAEAGIPERSARIENLSPADVIAAAQRFELSTSFELIGAGTCD